jgi:hypothetical protein
MVDDNDDCAPDLNDPLLDEFTWAAEGGEPTVVYERVMERMEVVRAFQNAVAKVTTDLWYADKSMLHIEALLAISGIFCGFADNLLQSCELETLAANREQVLKVVGIMSGHVNSIKPVVAQLTATETSGTVN